MKTVAIVAEYNPFHLGHKYHIQKSKQATGADSVVVLMSGNFVQRGDVAIADKFVRAREAVQNGADLVLEIPVCYSCQSAEIFARGSMEILDSLGVVDFLSFGSESADVHRIKQIADLLAEEDKEFQKNLKSYLSEGMSFPLARHKAVSDRLGTKYTQDIMASSNDILAIEYIKNLNLIKSKIDPFAIKRISSTYNDQSTDKIFPSATAIRNHIIENKIDQETTSGIDRVLSKSTTYGMAKSLKESFAQNNIASFDDFYQDLKTIIIREQGKIEKYFEVNEGIENLILKNILESYTLEDLIDRVKSKRYTRTRVRRTLLNILIGITKSDMKKIIAKDKNNTQAVSYDRPYTRILAFNDTGRSVLKQIGKSEKNSKIDIINKAALFKPSTCIQEIKLNCDNVANNIYYSKKRLYKNEIRVGSDIVISPTYI